MKRIYVFTLETDNMEYNYKNNLRLLAYMLYESIYNYYGDGKIPLNLSDGIVCNKLNETMVNKEYKFDSEICGEENNYYYEPFLVGDNSFAFTIVDDSFDINIIKQLLNQNLSLLKMDNKVNINVVTYYSVDEMDESYRRTAVEMVFEQHGVKLKKANWFDTLIEPFKQNKRR